MPLVEIVLLVVSILAALLLVIVAIWAGLRRLGRSTRAALLARVGEHNVLRLEPSANCFGIRSRGLGQVRGNGCWALINDRIVFDFWLGGRSFEIPLSTITNVHVAKSFLHKTKGRPLLIVEFDNDEGEPDAAAWLLGDVETARQEIMELLPAEA